MPSICTQIYRENQWFYAQMLHPDRIFARGLLVQDLSSTQLAVEYSVDAGYTGLITWQANA